MKKMIKNPIYLEQLPLIKEIKKLQIRQEIIEEKLNTASSSFREIKGYISSEIYYDLRVLHIELFHNSIFDDKND